MKIISFAWTTMAFLSGNKTETRRDWTDSYAKSFHKGDIVQAYDKNPRSGGKLIGLIKLTEEPSKQWLHDMTDADEVAEGHLWGSADKFREAMGKDREVWVIKFDNPYRGLTTGFDGLAMNKALDFLANMLKEKRKQT